MITRKMKVTISGGLHMEPATALVSACRPFDVDVVLKFGGNEYNLKSVLGVLAAGVMEGDEVEFVCIGPEEEQAMAALIKAFEGINVK